MVKFKVKTLILTLCLTVGMSIIPQIFFQEPLIVSAAESSVATATISEILENQQADGGWRKNYKTTSEEWSKSTIDNDATYTEIRKLAEEYTKTKNNTYAKAATKGINFLLKMQYSNGGWPQVYKGSGYHASITYNDDAMINVIKLLDEASTRKGNFSFVSKSLAKKCKNAVNKGIDCLLNTQVKVNGKLTIWGQQHNEKTLDLAPARIFEPASLCAKESATIVQYLKTRPQTSKIKASIEAAQNWFKENKLTGIKVVKANGDVAVVEDPNSTSPMWARFYEPETNKPIFVGRDGIIRYNLSEIDKERRTGYCWYGRWASTLIK